jgi:hypothetical protein
MRVCPSAEELGGASMPWQVFRILRRTIELLRSVAAVPYVSEQVQASAAAALRAMNRYPLTDNALMGLASSRAAAGAADDEPAPAA